MFTMEFLAPPEFLDQFLFGTFGQGQACWVHPVKLLLARFRAGVEEIRGLVLLAENPILGELVEHRSLVRGAEGEVGVVLLREWDEDQLAEQLLDRSRLVLGVQTILVVVPLWKREQHYNSRIFNQILLRVRTLKPGTKSKESPLSTHLSCSLTTNDQCLLDWSLISATSLRIATEVTVPGCAPIWCFIRAVTGGKVGSDTAKITPSLDSPEVSPYLKVVLR